MAAAQRHQFSGEDPWVSVDAAVSNDLFFADHFPMQLAQIKVTAPDGTTGKIENGVQGRYRATFDVHLTQQGTWRIGTEKRPDGQLQGGRRGKARGHAAPRHGRARRSGGPGGPAWCPWWAPADRDGRPQPSRRRHRSQADRNQQPQRNLRDARRAEAIATTGKGLEFAPITHPDDLVADQPAKLRFLVDGQPAKGLKLTIVPGGKRYRDAEACSRW
jgi:hypothetical protein